jgi:Ca-activated chloride channel family protein
MVASALRHQPSSIVKYVALLLLQAVISIRTELVTVPVTVTDPRGIHVSGLDRDDFRVYEDGRLRPIEVFHHGDAPVTLGLIVDRSGSTRAQGAVLQAAVSAVLQVIRADDEIFAVGFNDEATFARLDSQPFTSNPSEIERALSAIPQAGRTALYDGVFKGLKHLEQGRSAKKVLVVFSDGGDNASRETYARVLALARRSEAVVYAMGLPATSPYRDQENAGLLKRLCKDTGGVAYFPRAATDTIAAAMHMAGDFREQYLLGFVPEADGRAFRKIEVRVSTTGHGRLRVRARPGYVMAP